MATCSVRIPSRCFLQTHKCLLGTAPNHQPLQQKLTFQSQVILFVPLVCLACLTSDRLPSKYLRHGPEERRGGGREDHDVAFGPVVDERLRGANVVQAVGQKALGYPGPAVASFFPAPGVPRPGRRQELPVAVAFAFAALWRIRGTLPPTGQLENKMY